MIGFLDLPGEIRNLIYDHLLMFEAPIVPWEKKEALPVNLLYTNNRTVRHEFGSLFYSQITFDFSLNGPDSEQRPCRACLTKRIISFLDQIGENARHIQSIKIDFPYVVRDEDSPWDEAGISDHSAQVVGEIARNCIDLKKLILSPNVTFNILLDLAVIDLDEVFDLMLTVDEYLRTIPSLDIISVGVPDCDEYYQLMDEMEFSFRWQVEMINPDDFDWMSDDEEEDDEDEDEDDDDDADDYEVWDYEDSDEDDDDNDENDENGATNEG